tara:strand:+ start:495 stop:1229 length:735 start_codon:yes stop_codon:yes gene_type:complete
MEVELFKNKVLCVILARGGSKGVKNKNIKKINGYPLISYTIKSAIKAKVFTDIIVSTDSKRIKKIAEKFGAKVPFLRPKNISRSNSRPIDAIFHAFKFCEKKFNIKYDYIVEILCTNPLKKSLDIRNVINKQIRTNADSVIAVVKQEDAHPLRIKKIVDGKIFNFLPLLKEIPESRRQDLRPFAYLRCGSIYSMRRDMLLKRIRYGSKNSLAYIMPRKRVINIDEQLDFEFAEFFMKKYSIKPE